MGELYIPAGIFWFGWNDKISSPDTGIYDKYETAFEGSDAYYFASHPVFVDAYAIDDSRVTAAHLKLTLSTNPKTAFDSECAEFSTHTSAENDNFMAVSYPQCFEAACEMKGKRLCTEFEWEKAATGGAARLGVAESDWVTLEAMSPLWPWGDVVGSCELISSCATYNPTTSTPCETAVMSLPGVFSSYGVHDQFSQLFEMVISFVSVASASHQKAAYGEVAGIDSVIDGRFVDGKYWLQSTGSVGSLTSKGFQNYPSFQFFRNDLSAFSNARCCRSFQ